MSRRWAPDVGMMLALVLVLAFFGLPSFTDYAWSDVSPVARYVWASLLPCAIVLIALALIGDARLVRQRGLLSKTTVLNGTYASGDCECFCFDTHDPEFDHGAALREWMKANPNPSNDDVPEHLVDDSCRTYPNALLPEGSDKRKGRWTITITFEPEKSA